MHELYRFLCVSLGVEGSNNGQSCTSEMMSLSVPKKAVSFDELVGWLRRFYEKEDKKIERGKESEGLVWIRGKSGIVGCHVVSIGHSVILVSFNGDDSRKHRFESLLEASFSD